MPHVPKVILLIDGSRSYGRGVLRGIAHYSQLHGPWSFYNEPGEQISAMPNLVQWGADAVIAEIGNPTLLTKLVPLNIPTILIPLKKPIKGFPNVFGDWPAEGAMAAEYLSKRGFKHLAYCGFDEMYWSDQRGQGFTKKAVEMGAMPHIHTGPMFRLKNVWHWDKELASLGKFLRSLPKPAGVMACNDDRGRHILEACRQQGINVPEEIAVIGVDNDEEVCGLANPPLSSIAVNSEKAGYDAAAMLEVMMRDRKHHEEKILVTAQYVVTRHSTDVFAINDPSLAQAMRFIRENAPRKPVQVPDVAEAVALSRCSLESRFRKSLGISVHDEITHVRIKTIAQLLLDTNMSITQIATQMGFSGVFHIARYFRREMKMSPLAYRKKFKGR